MSGKRTRHGSQPRFEAEHGGVYCRENRLCVECGTRLKGRRRRWCSDSCVRAYQIRSDPQVARWAVLDRDKGVCLSCGLDMESIRKEVDAATDRANEAWWQEVGHKLYTQTGQRRLARSKPPSVFVIKNAKTPLDVSRKPYFERARVEVLEKYGHSKWWWRDSFWDADHEVAVVDGGGDLGLENMSTLCLVCHEAKSSEENARRARKRRATSVRRITRKPRERCRRISIGGCPCGEGRWRYCAGCQRYRKRALGASKGGR